MDARVRFSKWAFTLVTSRARAVMLNTPLLAYLR